MSRWSPLHGAFTFTLLALVLLLSGSLGYEMKKAGGVPYWRWAGGVVWDEIWWGIGAALVAGVFWTVALRSMRRTSLATPHRGW